MILALDGGRKRPSFYLLSASIVALLVTDFVYGLLTLNGTYTHQLSLDIGWIAFYLLWGAAALHPSMRELDRPSPTPASDAHPTAPRAADRRVADRSRDHVRHRGERGGTSTSWS